MCEFLDRYLFFCSHHFRIRFWNLGRVSANSENAQQSQWFDRRERSSSYSRAKKTVGYAAVSRARILPNHERDELIPGKLVSFHTGMEMTQSTILYNSLVHSVPLFTHNVMLIAFRYYFGIIIDSFMPFFPLLAKIIAWFLIAEESGKIREK